MAQEQDLSAQNASAFWAPWMFFVTLAGVFYVARTLSETRKATAAANKAADAALKANEGFSQASHRELRAYLAVSVADDDVEITANQPVRVKFRVKNVGMTPASSVVVASGICIRAVGWVDPTKGPEPTKDAPRSMLMPSADFAFFVDSDNVADAPWRPDASNLQNIRDGKQSIFVFGEVFYHDAIEPTAIRHTRFRYEINKGSLARRRMSHSAVGNEYD